MDDGDCLVVYATRRKYMWTCGGPYEQTPCILDVLVPSVGVHTGYIYAWGAVFMETTFSLLSLLSSYKEKRSLPSMCWIYMRICPWTDHAIDGSIMKDAMHQGGPSTTWLLTIMNDGVSSPIHEGTALMFREGGLQIMHTSCGAWCRSKRH